MPIRQDFWVDLSAYLSQRVNNIYMVYDNDIAVLYKDVYMACLNDSSMVCLIGISTVYFSDISVISNKIIICNLNVGDHIV